jgi:hypothetical protein
MTQQTLLPDHDKVWTWDGYSLKKRLKKHVDREIRQAEESRWARHPEAVFQTEAGGLLHVVSVKRAELQEAEKKADLARKALARWEKRLEAVS